MRLVLISTTKTLNDKQLIIILEIILRMSQVFTKVEIPSNKPDSMVDLGTNVEKHHTELAEASPLSGLDMVTLKTKVASAKDKRAQAKKLRDQAEVLNQQADLELGIDKTQNSKTPGTVLNILTSARDILLGLNRGQEEKLSEWGFKVIQNS